MMMEKLLDPLREMLGVWEHLHQHRGALHRTLHSRECSQTPSISLRGSNNFSIIISTSNSIEEPCIGLYTPESAPKHPAFLSEDPTIPQSSSAPPTASRSPA